MMIRMLIVGYAFGIRSERRLCEEVHLNLAYRWFCRLDLSDPVPDHSTFSKNRHGRFRDSDLFRRLFEEILARCIAEGLVGGETFGADASLIKADASRYTKVEFAEWSATDAANRATREYLTTLDDAAFGAATPREAEGDLACRSCRPAHRSQRRQALLRLQHETTWSTWRTRSSSTSKRPPRSGKPRWEPSVPC